MTRAIILFTCILASAAAQAKGPSPYPLILDRSGQISDTISGISFGKQKFAALKNIEENFPISVMRPPDFPLILLASSWNSIPVYVRDSSEYRVINSEEFISLTMFSELISCDVQDLKKSVRVQVSEMDSIETGGMVNSRAPGFQLYSADSVIVKSSDLLSQGPLVVAFVRSAFWEPLSRDLLKRLDANSEFFREASTSIVAVTGYLPDEIKSWKDSVAVSFPILSDRSIAVMYGYGAHFQGKLPYPMIFVLDSSGIIRYRENFDGLEEAPSMEKVVEAVKGLK